MCWHGLLCGVPLLSSQVPIGARVVFMPVEVAPCFTVTGRRVPASVSSVDTISFTFTPKLAMTGLSAFKRWT